MQDSKTMSVCTYWRDQGAQVIHIFGYSHYKNTAAGDKPKTLLSTKFPVGGHAWAVHFRADGLGDDIVGAGVLLATRHGKVPEPDIGGHYAKLLEEKVGVDVTLSVQGEEFMAHKVVLAARSPVFKAQLYGPVREAAGAGPIVIRDMQPAVFRELLNFIYADSLPPLDYLEADARTDMIRHLLVAADRYGMERLSLMCQGILCEGLRVQTVATTFALADQHHCDMLKDACLEFITCSTAMAAVKKTPGYKNLKRTCPPDVIEAFEKASRSRKS
ncbi:BTB/POZ and MATH domain-containing protein 2 [Dichanthelium oligosanthes]|uniref:BTB/POZ and MATH domain-containing protein 2 n=1 Tax=Dichanthelium oligosanthes TaxID=888268 RepID=A0A1E5VUU8_9POAL|nr:BTB/POZ and MATH domain-containing protein 2 [Dichanthelium oligosanthes]